MTAYNVTGSSYTFYWDGKNDSGEYVEPWTYTFEVDITQTDINYNENPALQVEDATEYRSRYLHILRSRDAFNNPIYEAEYAGYDDGDPNDPNDDSYLYYIRFYDLKDTLDMDASEGELWLYDPNVEKVYTWDVADLECLVEGHDECDGLHATSTGVMHELLVPVPSSCFDEPGTYRFVLHIKDDHLDKYRDHRKRWARDLNAKVGIVGYSILWADDTWRNDGRGVNLWGSANTAKQAITSIGSKQYVQIPFVQPGYKAFEPEGDPAGGGSGMIGNTTSRLGIRTLNRLAPGDSGKTTKNAIWVWYGHANPHALGFPQNDGHNNLVYDQKITNNVNPETDIQFNINNAAFNINHVLFAYLAGCRTAGCSARPDNLPHPIEAVSTENSIAQAFFNKGVKSVVGFFDATRWGSSYYNYFNTAFWNAAAKGETISKAVRAGLDAIPDTLKRYKKTSTFTRLSLMEIKNWFLHGMAIRI